MTQAPENRGDAAEPARDPGGDPGADLGVDTAAGLGADPYPRGLHDPAFLQAVDAAHHGRWAVLDALWWLEHPLEGSPAGTPSPAMRLEALQRRVFAENGDAAGDPDAAEALRRLQADITAERAQITAAIAVATATSAVTAAGDGAAGPEDAAVPGANAPESAAPKGAAPGIAVAEAGAPGSDCEPAQPASDDPDLAVRPARRRWVTAAALVGALGIGVVAGAQLGAAQFPGAVAPTRPEASTAVTRAGEGAPPVLAVRVFARPQKPIDRPLVPLPEAFDPDSFRYLGSAGFTDADSNGVTDSPYYAARGAENMICLVAVPEGSNYLSTCTREEEYPQAGLRLSWQSTDILSGADDPAGPMVLDITVAWLRDSTIETRGSGRSTIEE